MTETQRNAIEAHANRTIEDELEYVREHYPERYERCRMKAETDEIREQVIESARELAEEFLDRDECVKHYRRMSLHPSNRRYRKFFTDLTGVTLPGTVSGTQEALAEYIGRERLESALAAIEEERARKKRESDERMQANERKRLDGIREAVRMDKQIDGDDLVDVARDLGIRVHPRTVGMLRNRVRLINSYTGRISGRGDASSAHKLYQQCRDHLAK